MTLHRTALVALLAAAPLAAQDGGDAVDSLAARGRLQEAAWTARVAGDTARGEAILAELDSILRSPPLQARPLGMDSQGVSYTYRLAHAGGVEAAFKVDGSDIFCPECGADREVAAYRIDRLLGFDLTPTTVPQTIVRDGDTLRGSSMYWLHDTERPGDRGVPKPDRLRLFDAILGNSDRHRANWLLVGAGRPVAIDHNRAFEYHPRTRPKTCWETEIDSLAAPGSLGAPYERYRALPAESLAAPVRDLLSPELVRGFVTMRDAVVARIEQRKRTPARGLPRVDCPWDP
jgi:hypothetical protein